MNRIALTIAAAVLAAAPAFADVRVVDADTIDLGGTRYRIYGIDAPETGQTCATTSGRTWPCGSRATAALIALIDGREVKCEDMTLDEYGRMLAVCSADGIDIGEAMVASGMAWAYRRYGNAYDEFEDAVRPTGNGIWQADTEAPWDFRARRWNVEEQVAPAGCPIKGNINRQGERIYHVPWSQSYAKTSINESVGERWFCDEAEALAAGWRARR